MATDTPVDAGAASPAPRGRVDSPDPAAEGDARPSSTFDTPTIVAVASAHLTHDAYPAFVAVLLPLLIPELGISLAVAGLLASVYRWATVVQPILGYIADRRDTRYWIALAPAATAVSIGLLGLAPSVAAVALLLFAAGVSSSIFHPAAAALVTRSSGTHWGRGTSIFMTGGESGRAIGPLVIAGVLAAVGLAWSWLAMLPGIAVSIVLVLRVVGRPALQLRHPTGSIRRALADARWAVALLAATTVFGAMARVGLSVFIPTYVTEAGAGIVLAGAAVTTFEIGGAAGALLGGTLSDRIGRRAMLALGILIGAPLLMLALSLPPGPPMLVVLALAGVALLSGGPVQLVLMQELMPDNRGAAVGLSIFMVTVASAVGTIAVGTLGELIGLQQALIFAAASALLALPFVALLPETRQVSGRIP